MGTITPFARCLVLSNYTMNANSHHHPNFVIHLMDYNQGSLQFLNTGFLSWGYLHFALPPVVSQSVGGLAN